MKMNILTLVLFAATVIFCNNTFAQEAQRIDYIEVSTRVEKQVTPDLIYLGITIDEQQNKGKVYVETKEKEMIKALQALDIDVEKNLTVKDMESNLKKYFLKKNNILASKSYTLKVSTAEQAASVFQALNKISISDVSLERTAFSPELEKKVKDELLTAAAKKAKENATILAEAVGSKAGRAIYIQNYYDFSQPVMVSYARKSSMNLAMADAAVEESAPVLEINQRSISANVQCRFALETE